MYKYLMGGRTEDGARLFSVVPGEKTRGNRHKQKYRIFHLNIGKCYFMVRAVKHWGRLFGEVVQSLSFETVKAQLDTASGNLLWLPQIHQALDWTVSRDASNLSPPVTL